VIAQTRLAIQNLRAALQASGATLDDVLSVDAYLTDSEHFAEFNAVYAEFFRAPYPARTTVYAGLRPGVLVEVSDGRPGTGTARGRGSMRPQWPPRYASSSAASQKTTPRTGSPISTTPDPPRTCARAVAAQCPDGIGFASEIFNAACSSARRPTEPASRGEGEHPVPCVQAHRRTEPHPKRRSG
jgi:hypothetical protein